MCVSKLVLRVDTHKVRAVSSVLEKDVHVKELVGIVRDLLDLTPISVPCSCDGSGRNWLGFVRPHSNLSPMSC